MGKPVMRDRSGIVFQHAREPKEGAFHLCIPAGWQMQGGIGRPRRRDGRPDRSRGPRVDFAVKRDPAGTAMIRWHPRVEYIDPRGLSTSIVASLRSSGPGVCPLMSARQFLTQILFPHHHPYAVDVQFIDQQDLPELARWYREQASGPGTRPRYDSALVTLSYREGGVPFREKAFTVIEDRGQAAGGRWCPQETVVYRAQEGEFATLEPVLLHVWSTMTVDNRWLALEAAAQTLRERDVDGDEQAEVLLQRRADAIYRQIEAQERTNGASQVARLQLAYALTRWYMNPHSHQPELGSSAWTYRWVTPVGDELYTDYRDDNPNLISLLKRTDWALCPALPESPGPSSIA